MGSQHWERIFGSDDSRKVYIIGGISFDEFEGHTLITFKALYGLKALAPIGMRDLLMYSVNTDFLNQRPIAMS